MPFKDSERKREYDKRRYLKRKGENLGSEIPTKQGSINLLKQDFEEHKGYREAFEEHRPIPFEGFGEDKKGLVLCCSRCGTPLTKFGCPICDYIADF